MNTLANDLDHILTYTADVWVAVRGQQIFVTGGTGFFGRWLLESFAWANSRLNLGARCVVLSRNPTAFLRGAPHLGESVGILWVAGDVRTFSVADVVGHLRGRARAEFRFIIHAASESTTKLNEESPLTVFDTGVLGMRNVLEFAVCCETRRLLFTSSGAVYGPQPSDLTHIPEEFGGGPDPLAVSSAYAEGKRAAEHLCAQWHRIHPTLEPVIARCFAFTGPHLPLDAHFAVGNFVRDALAGGPIKVRGDGTPLRSYLYAADLVIWLWTILLRAKPLRAINVGSGESVDIAALAHQIAALRSPKPAVEIANVARARTAPQRYLPNVERAARELGLVARIGLENALRQTISFHEK
jgi:nucleoside-diphosphate-sugar epimerase